MWLPRVGWTIMRYSLLLIRFIFAALMSVNLYMLKRNADIVYNSKRQCSSNFVDLLYRLVVYILRVLGHVICLSLPYVYHMFTTCFLRGYICLLHVYHVFAIYLPSVYHVIYPLFTIYWPYDYHLFVQSHVYKDSLLRRINIQPSLP